MDFFTNTGYKYTENAASSLFWKPPAEGRSVIRIVSKCTAGWRYFTEEVDGTRKRHFVPEKPTQLPDNALAGKYSKGAKEVKEVWVLAVIDRVEGGVKLAEIHQSTIKKGINDWIVANEAPPTLCDFSIVASKKGGTTIYTVTPITVSQGPLSPEDQALVSQYHIDTTQIFVPGGKCLVSLAQPQVQAAPAYAAPAVMPAYAAPVAPPAQYAPPAQPAMPLPPEPTIAQQLRSWLEQAQTPERVKQCEEWALANIAHFDAAYGVGVGAEQVAQICAPYRAKFEQAPAQPAPLPPVPTQMPMAMVQPPAYAAAATMAMPAPAPQVAPVAAPVQAPAAATYVDPGWAAPTQVAMPSAAGMAADIPF